MKEKLTQAQKDSDMKVSSLIQQVVTRWNSLYHMIERIIENYAAIDIVLYNDESHRNLQLSNDEIDCLKKAMIILKPYLQVTEILSAERYSSSSCIVSAISYLQNYDSGERSEFLKLLLVYLKEKLSNYVDKYDLLSSDFLIASSFLNPSYKKFGKVKLEKKKKAMVDTAKGFRKKTIKAYSKEIGLSKSSPKKSNETYKFSLSDESDCDENNSQQIITDLSIKKEINSYMMEDKCSESEFWSGYHNKYPLLTSVYKKLCSIPATSTPSERLFSASGYQIWDRRNKISPQRVEQILFIYENE